MAKIIKEGEQIKYAITCKKCGTVSEFEASELKHYLGMDDEKLVEVTCPKCRHHISFLESKIPKHPTRYVRKHSLVNESNCIRTYKYALYIAILILLVIIELSVIIFYFTTT